jgi:hypothetical protein
MYKRYQIDPANRRDKTIPDYGHETTSKNRDLMINTLSKAFFKQELEINDLEELREMGNFIWDDHCFESCGCGIGNAGFCGGEYPFWICEFGVFDGRTVYPRSVYSRFRTV